MSGCIELRSTRTSSQQFFQPRQQFALSLTEFEFATPPLPEVFEVESIRFKRYTSAFEFLELDLTLSHFARIFPNFKAKALPSSAILL